MDWDRRKAASEEKDRWAAHRPPDREDSAFAHNAVISFPMSLGNRVMRGIVPSAEPE